MNTQRPTLHFVNDKSPELHEIHERMKILATEYLIAFDNNVQDIGTPSAIAKYFIDQVIEQSK